MPLRKYSSHGFHWLSWLPAFKILQTFNDRQLYNTEEACFTLKKYGFSSFFSVKPQNSQTILIFAG